MGALRNTAALILLTQPKVKQHCSSHLLAIVLRSSSFPSRRVSGDTPSKSKSPGRRKWLKICANNVVLLSAGLIILVSLGSSLGKAQENEETPIADPDSLEALNPSTKPIYIEHPNSEKGLRRITRKGEYIYDVERTPQKQAASLRVGVFSIPNLSNEVEGRTIYFDEIYTDSGSTPVVFFDYEWQIYQKFGKLGLTVGSGMLVATGKGVFKDGSPAMEKYTFLAMPNSGGAIYRLHIWERQPIVPYAGGGLHYFTFAEIRDDDSGPKFGGALAAYVSLGGAFNLNFLDSRSILELDRFYGINTVFITFEYRRVEGLNDRFDFTSDVFNGGLTLEF